MAVVHGAVRGASLILTILLLPGCAQPTEPPASPEAADQPMPDPEPQRGRPTPTAPAAPSATTGPPPTRDGTVTSRAAPAPLAVQSFAARRADPSSLEFTFAFSAVDPSGRAMSWTLDADGDGQADAQGQGASGTATHAYASSRAYTARLAVRAGDATAEASLEVDATVPPFTISDDYVGWDPVEAASPGGCPMAGPAYKGEEPWPPVGGHWYKGIDGIGGWNFRVEPVGAGLVAWFNEMDGAVYTGGGTDTGTVPPRTHYVYVCATQPGPGGNYTFMATHP